jgi:hypothetical protein
VTLVTTACAALSAVAFGTVPASAAPASKATAATKSVTYLGRQFTVPAAWPIVDLAKARSACVRFDQHAVYLGTPGTQQDCPAHAMGRTEAVLIEPAAVSNAPAKTVENSTERDFTATASGMKVTVTYNGDRALAQSILGSAALPAASADTATARVAAPKAAAPDAAHQGAVQPATIADGSTDFTGLGFDACAAPSAGAMSAWKAASPYSAVGVYFGGATRTCSQPNLTAGWVSQQAAAGWRFLMLYPGLQAPGNSCGCATFSTASQGSDAADDAADIAASLGFPAGSTLTYDMESYSSGSALPLAFEAAWTNELHARGYRSGVYGSMGSTIGDLVNNYSSSAMPDIIDFANPNGSSNLSDPAIPSGDWADHQRVHQYTGGHTETYGSVQIDIDADSFDVQLGSPTPSRLVGSQGLAPNSGNGFTAAWVGRDSNESLWLATGSNAQLATAGDPYAFGVAAGTTPSIATLSNGTWVAAWQGRDANNSLWIATGNGLNITAYGDPYALGVAPNTSPSIVALPGNNWEVAWQGKDQYKSLWLATGSGAQINAKNNPGYLGVADNSSPSLAALPNGGYEVAWQGRDAQNTLWVASGTGISLPSAADPYALGVAAGTSPSLATLPNGSFEVAWQGRDSNNSLWLASGTGTSIAAKGEPYALGVAAGTSPSLAILPNGSFEVAWHGRDSNNSLWLATGTGAVINSKGYPYALGIADGHSPALVALPDGDFEAMWKGRDANGNLWVARGNNMNIFTSGAPGALGVL